MTGDNGSIRFNIVSTSTLKVVEDSLTVRGGNGRSGAATGPLSFLLTASQTYEDVTKANAVCYLFACSTRFRPLGLLSRIPSIARHQ